MTNELKFGLELTWNGSAASAGLASFTKDLGEVRKLVTGLDPAFKKFSEGSKLAGTGTKQLATDVTGLQRGLQWMDSRLASLNDNLKLVARQSSSVASEFNRMTAESKAAGQSVQNIEYHFHNASNAASGMRRELGLLKGSMSDFQKVAMAVGGAGIGYGAFSLARQSGRLDASLTSIMQTGDATVAQRNALRPELFRLARQSGRPVEDVAGVMDYLVQTGLTWDQSLAGTRATVPAMAVTKADGRNLAQSLVTASNLYGFDLTKPGVAGNVMDLMRAGGKAGAAEMENLSQVLPIFAPSARRAGMDFKESLAYIETLSNIVAQPHKLGTLADATLRIWTQKKYTDQVSAMTGVPFFEKNGAWRPKGDVITDIVKFAGKHGTDDRKMHDLMGMLFQGMDEEGVRGFSMLVQDPRKIQRMSDINSYINQAPGMLGREMPQAIDNVIDQSARLRTAMRQIADDFAQPINKALANLIEFSMKPKAEGGLELSNGQMLGLGAGALLGGGLLARGAAGLFRKIPGLGGVASSAIGTAAGVVEGKTLERMAGVQPVFVVNMPGNGFGGGTDAATGVVGGAVASRAAKGLMGAWRMLAGLSASEIGSMGMGAMGTAGAFVGGAGLAGYGAGTLLYNHISDTDFADKLGGAIAQALANLGSSTAQTALDERFSGGTVHHELKVQIDSDGKPKVKRVQSGSPDFDISVFTGATMVTQ